MQLRPTLINYSPTIFVVSGLVAFEFFVVFPDALPRFLWWPFYLAFDVILIRVLKHVPGIWENGFILTMPTFGGWLIASLVLAIAAFVLNYFLVVRNKFVTATGLCIIFGAVLLYPLLLEFVYSF